MGLSMVARTKGTSGNDLPPKQTDLWTTPTRQEEIPFPTAPARAGPGVQPVSEVEFEKCRRSCSGVGKKLKSGHGICQVSQAAESIDLLTAAL
jgi:hypothetical protein